MLNAFLVLNNLDIYFLEPFNKPNPTMQKIFITAGIAICILSFLSCKGPVNTNETAASQPIPPDSAITDNHNSLNSLDVEGIYKGVLPCADCEGIEAEIVLSKDETFIKRTKYLGKEDKVFEEKGAYTWNETGNIIKLSGIKNGPDKYFVGENYLTQLDMNANKITGNLASKYILTKQPETR
jgi:uncharacterized lipoprotein NlpE involved in copper resistance